jgi:hypothetical protein
VRLFARIILLTGLMALSLSPLAFAATGLTVNSIAPRSDCTSSGSVPRSTFLANVTLTGSKDQLVAVEANVPGGSFPFITTVTPDTDAWTGDLTLTPPIPIGITIKPQGGVVNFTVYKDGNVSSTPIAFANHDIAPCPGFEPPDPDPTPDPTPTSTPTPVSHPTPSATPTQVVTPTPSNPPGGTVTPDVQPPSVKLLSKTVKVDKKGRATVKYLCDGASQCKSRLKLSYKKGKKTVVAYNKSIVLKSQVKSVTVKLSKASFKKLKKAKATKKLKAALTA